MKLCKACGGPVCPFCGGCVNEGECVCDDSPTRKATINETNEWAREHEDELIEFVRLCKEYPGESVLTIWDEVFEPQTELSPAEHDAWPTISRIA